MLAVAVAGFFLACTLGLVLLRWFDPPTTALQAQRRVESWFEDAPYVKRYDPVPLARVSADLGHAVVAAEDTRFYRHHGVDWSAIGDAVEDNLERGRAWRGGSTITQQLVKNLFLTTRGGFLRKAAEVPLAYTADAILSKDRILELYLDVIEWDRGVYGAEAAARHYYGVPASRLTRLQSASLAAIIPRPRVRRPWRMTDYRERILGRMAAMGW